MTSERRGNSAVEASSEMCGDDGLRSASCCQHHAIRSSTNTGAFLSWETQFMAKRYTCNTFHNCENFSQFIVVSGVKMVVYKTYVYGCGTITKKELKRCSRRRYTKLVNILSSCFNTWISYVNICQIHILKVSKHKRFQTKKNTSVLLSLTRIPNTNWMLDTRSK